MRKIRDDVWTQNQVISTFAIDLESSSLQSEMCGFGWLFSASVNINRKVGLKEWPPTIEFEFNPNFIRNASYGTLNVSVIGVNTDTHTEASVTLPSNSLEEWHYLGSIAITRTLKIATATFQITVTFPANMTLPSLDRAPSSAPSSVGNILKPVSMSIDTGEFIDVKFRLFSRRQILKRSSASEPEAAKIIPISPRFVYASSRLLTGITEYMDDLLQGGFRDSSVSATPLTASDYDYIDFDSDLDEDESDAGTPPSGSSTKQSRGVSPVVSLVDSDELNTGASTSQGTQTSRAEQMADHIGREIQLSGWAYRTWKSLVLYAYSGEIHFATIGSKNRIDNPWSCSPKSMYRLAHEMRHDELKRLSLESIKDQLTKENIAHEVFSWFTAQYEDVLDVETTFFCENFDSLSDFDQTVFREICEPRNANAIFSIMQKLAHKPAIVLTDDLVLDPVPADIPIF